MQDRFKKILEEKGLNAQRAAKIIGIDASAVSHIINGRRRPGFDVLQKLSNAFPDLNLNWLVNGQGNMYTSQELENSSGKNEDNISVNERYLDNSDNEVKNKLDSYIPSNVSRNILGDDVKKFVNGDDISTRKQVKMVIVVYDDGSVENFTSK